MSLTYLHKIILLIVLMGSAAFFVVRFKIKVTAYAPTENQEIQRVEVLQFYSLKENNPNLYTDAYYLEIKNKFSLFDFINPKGYFIGNKGETDQTHFSSQRLNFNKQKNIANFKGDVALKKEPLTVDCQQGTYWTDTEIFACKDRVKVFALQAKTRDELTINSDEVKAFFVGKYSLHKGNVFGVIKRPLMHEPPTDFSSNDLSFYFDQGQANLENNVHVTHGEYDIKSRKGEILIENYNKKLKYFAFDDDVVVEQKSRRIPGGKRVAYAEKMEGVRSEGTVVLTGAPRVVQGKDVIKGNKITLRQGAGLIEVDDAASNMIYEQKQPSQN